MILEWAFSLIIALPPHHCPSASSLPVRLIFALPPRQNRHIVFIEREGLADLFPPLLPKKCTQLILLLDTETRFANRATSFPLPSHILHTFSSEPHRNARPSIIFQKCRLICRLKTFWKNPATLGRKYNIWFSRLNFTIRVKLKFSGCHVFQNKIELLYCFVLY